MGKLKKTQLRKLIDNKILPVIAGPTASGKTAVSVELARMIDIEVISADSRQLFKFMNIGTATPSKDELAAVKTHFINILKPDEYYSAGKFANQAEKKINKIYLKNKIPFVVGGSGLYIKALCEGIFDDDTTNEAKSLVYDLYKELEMKDIDALYDELVEIDPVSAKKYCDKNIRRILRALVYYKINGIPFSEAHCMYKKPPPFKPVYFGIEYPRQELYDRINTRTEIIWKSGLLRETNNLLSRGFHKDLNALNTVGYKEAIAFLDGEISELEAIEKMKQNTRRYAKRQITWFKKIPNLIWLRGKPNEIAQKIIDLLNNY